MVAASPPAGFLVTLRGHGWLGIFMLMRMLNRQQSQYALIVLAVSWPTGRPATADSVQKIRLLGRQHRWQAICSAVRARSAAVLEKRAASDHSTPAFASHACCVEQLQCRELVSMLIVCVAELLRMSWRCSRARECSGRGRLTQNVVQMDFLDTPTIRNESISIDTESICSQPHSSAVLVYRFSAPRSLHFA